MTTKTENSNCSQGGGHINAIKRPAVKPDENTGKQAAVEQLSYKRWLCGKTVLTT